MKSVPKRFEVLVEHVEVSRVVVHADSDESARDAAFEAVRRGEAFSSQSVSSRCVGCRELPE